MQELNANEIELISGGNPSGGLAAVSGILWAGAEMSAMVPGGQGAAAFLGLGAGILAAGSGIAYLMGQ